MRTFALTFLAIVIGVSPKAKAGVIARDLAAPGDGLLTYDTINEREWLDLPETIGIPLAEVMSQTGPGGRLEGFRFAALPDVSDLAASAGVGWTTWSLPFNAEPHAPELVELLGWVARLSGGVAPEIHIALGLIATDNTTSVPSFDDTNFFVVSMYDRSLLRGQSNHPLFFPNTPRGGVFTSGPISGPELPPLGIGDIGPFWLYRGVPEPGAGLLLVQSLAGIIVLRNTTSWLPIHAVKLGQRLDGDLAAIDYVQGHSTSGEQPHADQCPAFSLRYQSVLASAMPPDIAPEYVHQHKTVVSESGAALARQ